MIVILVGMFFLFTVFLSMGFGLYFLSPAEKDGKEQIIIVREGLPLKEIVDELERRKVITNKVLFMLWARLMGYSRKIKAGEYLLSPNMAPVKILEKLTRGAIITHSITVPEGFTKKQIAELLDRKGLANKQQFLSLSDAYQFGRGISASTVIDAMVKHFWQVVTPLKGRMEEARLRVEEVITLASIVEKETGRPRERPTIASVFLNRLKRGMRLYSDPTVIYGLKDFNGNLTRKDLLKPTPYNTYIIHGLPPGPIANPGLESIKAVLYPARTDYLYFVSKNDGSHHFSKTLSDHNRAVRIYQKKRRIKSGKTS